MSKVSKYIILSCAKIINLDPLEEIESVFFLIINTYNVSKRLYRISKSRELFFKCIYKQTLFTMVINTFSCNTKRK